MQVVRRTNVARGDLLWSLLQRGDRALEEVAALAGFIRIAPGEVKGRQPENVEPSPPMRNPLPPQTESKKQVLHSRFPIIVQQQQVEEEPITNGMPEKLAGAKAQSLEDQDPTTLAPPPRSTPLVPWSRLWPFLRASLGCEDLHGPIDFPIVIERIARGKVLRRLPRTRRSGWARRCQVLLDFDERLMPFRQDVRDTWRRLKRLRGEDGMEVLVIQRGPEGLCRDAGKKKALLRSYRLPDMGAPVLVLGDLGTCDPSGEAQTGWIRLGQRLRKHGHLPVALTLSSPNMWGGDLHRDWHMVCWDRGGRLPSARGALTQTTCGGRAKERGDECYGHTLERLATLLSGAIFVEPALLRAIRMLIPGADVGMESELWSHKHVISSSLGLVFEKTANLEYQAGFTEEALHLETADAIARLTSHLPPSVRAVQWLTYERFSGDHEREEVKWANEYAVRLARTSVDERFENHPGRSNFMRRALERQRPDSWEHWAMAVALVASDLEAYREGDLALPPSVLMEEIGWMLGPKEESRTWTVRQREGLLVFDPDSEDFKIAHGAWPLPSPRIGELRASRRVANIVSLATGESLPVLRLAVDRPVTVPMPDDGGLKVATNEQEVLILDIERPAWASEMGYDTYGLYLEFEVHGVVQRMRWITPGRFLMGSPEDELDRLDHEIQHAVTLTQGFWLADTACTQALWKAVTGRDPSHFNGPQQPVENVSWEDCRDFIRTLNAQVPELGLRLPKEAEWEYACRAGTLTPFSFGANISAYEVNYDGNFPYADGAKGDYRKETVDVKLLPCNPWGLYEMHGNVLEWCEDWFGEYPNGNVVDPSGPASGEDRVLRGGSWRLDAQDVRSAVRNGDRPGSRDRDIGFRLARGPLRLRRTGGAGLMPDGPTGRRWDGIGGRGLRLRAKRSDNPSWAIRSGEDMYGRYADFVVHEVVQRMRWIAPGHFLMGSPEDEEIRESDETQHAVTLTHGFWLAETACTQALWKAVMGRNPSNFKGNERPVETISWEDCQDFIQDLNAQVPELGLRLPKEAEWEYACRAGTMTAFSFGANITPDEVNYNGNYPYADGAKGDYRQETVDVKSLPCNPWELYEMHGNVWEWCEDWFGEYPDGKLVDPSGPASGESRVLRGGSWLNFARLVRSAVRFGLPPGSGNHFIGFRLARGQ